MKLFSRKKEQLKSCDCNEMDSTKKSDNEKCCESQACYAKVLGSGCAKCNTLSEHTKQALEQLNMDTCIQKVTDFTEIAKYGVMSTPALILGDKVISTGKVLSVEEIKNFILKGYRFDIK